MHTPLNYAALGRRKTASSLVPLAWAASLLGPLACFALIWLIRLPERFEYIFIVAVFIVTAGAAVSISIAAVVQQFSRAGATLGGRIVAIVSLLLALVWPAFCALLMWAWEIS